MASVLCVSGCTLNQWALDFTGNYRRILESIKRAKAAGSKYRSGPELEIPGYGCADHFFEFDTELHSWEVLAKLLDDSSTFDIICDVGMAVSLRGVLYNVRVIFLNKKILLIRPKMTLCDDGNYRESRWFTPWRYRKHTEEYTLPPMVTRLTEQVKVPFGDALLETKDSLIGYEICEELWNPNSTNIDACLCGAEIIFNSSGSYHELRKRNLIRDLVASASLKSACVYVFSNLRGCDGERVYYQGLSNITMNGRFLAVGKQFGLEEVEVITAKFFIEDIRARRAIFRSRGWASTTMAMYPHVRADIYLVSSIGGSANTPIEWPEMVAEMEISLGPACWLWDYLRRSGQGGFFLPLSGGVDSASVGTIVYSMCTLIDEAIKAGNQEVLGDLRTVIGDSKYMPPESSGAREICQKLLFTCYMGTENSSQKTKSAAKNFASQIGASHQSIIIDTAVRAIVAIFVSVMGGRVPKFQAHGGSTREDLALQNVQARVRMLLSYLFAQLLLWGSERPGGLLVLATGNMDEALRGYLTKYDCSSGDINPIGSISKTDLKKFLRFAVGHFNLNSLEGILDAPPTAELTPLREGQVVQTDEADMGMTYAELSTYGSLRKQHGCGPLAMYLRITAEEPSARPADVARKWKWQFKSIDRYVSQMAISSHPRTLLSSGSLSRKPELV
ncbi:glutamine-dependent NAD(+) synthetase-like isoform X2 [Varroa jacobsoni]|uniref:Glutamine-dependent NAD(+) synthetase n=1 Tax=Varroa destructor TaxID=109461 RepID=A0A7M7JBC4_VARDE|nr:glutamine-dependent NAD(+) synthetase-like isoform X2 [Varroa destructor]XP_022698888.1 glutamine-dependent NAD(+) synthetase-like isoform X2 [Varroa jacobsoni]